MFSIIKFHRNLATAIIVLLAVACKSHEPVDILADYEVAMTNETPLRYYYHRMPENDTTWTDYRTVYEGQQKFVIEEQFADGLPTSKYKHKVKGQTQEIVEKIYYNLRDSVTGDIEAVKADIIQHLQMEPENDYSGFSFVDYYELSIGVGIKLKAECKYGGKETYHYNGRNIESIKLDHQFKMVTYFKWLPFYFHHSNFKGYVILSKGIGMTLYRAEDSDGIIYSQKLLRVEEIESKL